MLEKQIHKYARFLLEGCLALNEGEKLFITGNKEIEKFVDIVIEEAHKLKITDIETLITDSSYQKNLYLTKSYEEIIKDPKMDKTKYNKMAKEGYAFLSLSSPLPGYLKEVDPTLLAKVQKYISESMKEFREYQDKDLLKWNISAVPNPYWAKALNLQNEEELWKYIFEICLIDEENDPVKLWKEKLAKLKKRAEYLNSLKIEKLIYKNFLGTNLEIFLPENYLFQSAEGKNIVNMPTEEVFTSPHYAKTNGVVYSSKPLEYQGNLVEDFYLEFKNGKVVSYNAKKGKDILKGILETDEGSSYLGETALVDISSPIAKTNKIFLNTLIDENSCCHLALGQSFGECIKGGLEKNQDELKQLGLNTSKNHVDFFIGTKDLTVEAVLKNGEKKMIMENGNFKEENL